ncbi:MAG: archease [Dehalococcoidia bacterium]|nr:MAG: archease [Dehalococcoidia bacterium]
MSILVNDIIYLVEKEFEIIDHTADVGVIAYGASVNQAFVNAARALFSLITELDNVEEVVYRDIELVAPDQESLLVEWLNELIYLFDTENIIFKRFDITQLNSTQLKARGYGEKVDSSKHKLKTGVKAATYHMLKVEKTNGCQVQVLFDI